ncbi:MAG: SDR family NAD(P)-dependent oxidoreductase [Proteobacteria bacterium]|nr:SDR family NAD(P)-dependent oxidoreductase [Pseudomonadota bacterium]MDA1062741.1 SDR family NAD(P)-dependent oxidoreductase [Pseudomonadota bacterium]
MNIRLDGQVAIITGAGRGLGRAHALALAERGARVVVNDLGDAESVVAEITAAGGQAIANAADVTDFVQVTAMVSSAMDNWGRVDILVNNAGILRDKSFQKMSMDDFRRVVDVHLMGSANCSKAVWDIMRAQAYGRIVFTTSSSGLYGNFGQANYGAAKMAVVGLMNTLHLEGAKYDIRVNCLAPAAGTAMTDGVLPPAVFDLLTPESVSPGLVFLVSQDAPRRVVLAAGGGAFAIYQGFETIGVSLLPDQLSAEGVAAAWNVIAEHKDMQIFASGLDQASKFATMSAAKTGIKL